MAIHGMGATLSDTLTPIAVGALLTAFPWESVLQLQIIPGLLLGFLIWKSLAGFFGDSGTPAKPTKQIREIADLARNPVFIEIGRAHV